MMGSLAKTLTLPDATVVLPGHGPQTTIGAERDANPFLAGLQSQPRRAFRSPGSPLGGPLRGSPGRTGAVLAQSPTW